MKLDPNSPPEQSDMAPETVVLNSKPNRWIYPILLVGFLSYGCAMWWGLPGEVSWAIDSIDPNVVIFGEWKYPYPPLHRYLLYLLYSPIILAAKWGWIDLSTVFDSSLPRFLGRGLSVLMGTGIIWLVFLTGLELFKKRLPALLSAFFVLCIVSMVYYSKTMNVEVPYVFWFAGAVLFYVRAIQGDRFVDYLLFFVAASLSVCTKDQAYGLFVLPSIFLIYNHFKCRQERRIKTKIIDFSAKLILPFLLGVMVFLAVHQILVDITFFIQHLGRLNTASYEAGEFFARSQNNLQEHLFLMYRFFRDIRFNLGWPLSAIALISIVSCFFKRQEKSLLLCLLLPCVSYYLFFISIILYSRDRFLLPVCVILCLFCGDFIADFIEDRNRWRSRLKIGLVSVICIYSLMYANSVNLLMLQDSRYTVENWMRQNIESPGELCAVGFLQYHPRFDRLEGIEASSIYPSDLSEIVEQQTWPYIVTTSGYYRDRFPEDTGEYRGFQILETTPEKYRIIFEHQSTPIWNFLDIETATSKEFYDNRFKAGNFNKINPEIRVFERVKN